MMNKWLIKKLGGILKPETDKEREELIKELHGFVSVDDVMLWLQTKEFIEKNKILTLAVKHLFNTISAEDILRQRNDGTWLFEGKVLPEGIQKQLTAEASMFINTKLWKILQTDVRYQANKAMFLKATDPMQISAGKFWLYTLDCFKTRLDSMSKGSAIFHN